MPRLTRAESQVRTRDTLLATATTCFLRDGYAATTLEGIAEAAGYSKGAVYSNFANKDELCLAVLERVRAEQAASLAEALGGADSLEARIDAFERWAEEHIGDRAWTTLEIEFAVHAGRHTKLAERLVKDNTEIRDLIVGVLRHHAEETQMTPPLPIEDIGHALLSLGIGLGLQRALDPNVSVRSIGQLVRLFAGVDVAKKTTPNKRSAISGQLSARKRRKAES